MTETSLDESSYVVTGVRKDVLAWESMRNNLLEPKVLHELTLGQTDEHSHHVV